MSISEKADSNQSGFRINDEEICDVMVRKLAAGVGLNAARKIDGRGHAFA